MKEMSLEKLHGKIIFAWLSYWVVAALLLTSSLQDQYSKGAARLSVWIPAIMVIAIPAVVVIILYVLKIFKSQQSVLLCCFIGTIVAYFAILVSTGFGFSLAYYTVPMLFGAICIKRIIVKIANCTTFGLSAAYMLWQIFSHPEEDSTTFAGLLIGEAIFMLGSNFVARCTETSHNIHIAEVQSVTDKVQAQKDEIEFTIENIADDMLSLNKSIDVSKEQNVAISTSMSDMAGVIEDIADSVDKQNVATSDLQKQISTVHESATLISTVTSDFETLTRANISSLSTVKEISDEANQSVTQVSDSIETLKEKAEQVSQSIAGIDAITRKTSILALNAAIEAARAGTAGRGFTVVAEEIQHLVAQTTQATTAIKEILADFNASFDTMTNASSKVINTITEQVSVVDQMTTEFTATFSKFDDVVRVVDELEKAVEVSVKSVTDISESINSISATCEEVSATSEEVSASSQQVTEEILSIKDSAASVENRLKTLVENE